MRTSVLLLVLMPVVAVAGTPVTNNVVTEVFAQTCMANFFRPAGLIAQLQTSGATLLDGAASSTFLTGVPGLAWQFRADGTDFVVARRDDGVCATYAKQAAVGQVTAEFKRLVGSAPPPLVAVSLEAERFGPNEGELATVAYGWAKPGEGPALVFSLTTSTEETSLVAAMLTVGTTPGATREAATGEAVAGRPRSVP